MGTSAKLIIFLFSVLAMASCGPAEVKNPVLETAVALLNTAYAETQIAITATQVAKTPTLTPTFLPPTGQSGAHQHPTPSSDQQVYFDPEGWYFVYFPADMHPTNKPNTFAWSGQLFETGYLPELGYSSVNNVCSWLANVVEKPEESSIYLRESQYSYISCSITTKESGWPTVRYEVIENPVADPEHRFIYNKTAIGYDSLSFETYFAWLPHMYEAQLNSDSIKQNSDEISFWKNVINLPPSISITEYALPPEKNPNTNDGLFQYIPTQAWSVTNPKVTPTPRKITLQDLGYEIRRVPDSSGRSDFSQHLYRNGRLLFENVTGGSAVYTFSTEAGTITAFIIEVDTGVDRLNYVIQNDAISVLGGYSIYTSAPVLHEGELLWARMYGNRIEIKKSNGEIIYTLAIVSMPNKYPRFIAWNYHWILQWEDLAIQDGEILNKKLGFQEMFNWSLVQDKPTYFFRKGSGIGISHDGQIFPIKYQEVAHGMCCSPAANNPGMGNDSIRFFGKRDGIWYYVVVKFE